MSQKLIHITDVHADLDALETAIDFGMSEEVDRIIVTGDVSFKHYTARSLQKMTQDEEAREVLLHKQSFTYPDREAMLKRDSVLRFIEDHRIFNTHTLACVKEVLEDSKLPYYIINGNYDSINAMQNVFGDRFVHRKPFTIGLARVYSFGGATMNPPHVQLLQKLGEADILSEEYMFREMMRERSNILLTHMPPHNLCDKSGNNNIGSGPVLAYISQHKPNLVLCGHRHKEEVAKYTHRSGDKTTVVNSGNLGRYSILHPILMEREPEISPERAWPYGTFSIVEIEEDGTPVQVKQYSCQPRSKIGRRSISKVREICEQNIGQLTLVESKLLDANENLISSEDLNSNLITGAEARTMFADLLKQVSPEPS